MERFGTDPTAQLVALPQGERDRCEADARILRDRIPFDAERSILLVQDAVISCRRTPNDCPVAMPLLKRGLEQGIGGMGD